MTEPSTRKTGKAPPPGKRWGRGLESLLPFLNKAFRSRPHAAGEESVLGFLETTSDDGAAASRLPQAQPSKRSLKSNLER